jgi:hypothetical protein
MLAPPQDALMGVGVYGWQVNACKQAKRLNFARLVSVMVRFASQHRLRSSDC